MRMPISRIQKQRAVCSFLLTVDSKYISLSEGHSPRFCREVPASFILLGNQAKSQFLLNKSLVSVTGTGISCPPCWFDSVISFFHPEILGAYGRLQCSCSLQLLLNMKRVCATALDHQQFQCQPSSRGK